MAIRNARALTFQPSGVCDAVDGTNVPAGAMRLLTNLIPDPTTNRIFIARPAAALAIDFAAEGFSSPGFISGMLVVGDLVFGTIASARNAGKDEPFCFNMATGLFLTVAGITNANTPRSPPETGEWTPPILAQIASRIIVCHPGFPGGAVKFGWFDLSGSSGVITANTHTTVTLDGNPSIIGVQPGMIIAGPNIPANTSVVSTSEFVLVTSGMLSTGGQVTLINNTTGIAVGQEVLGFGIQAGTVVLSVTGVPFTSVGNTHTNTVLDGLDPLLGIPSLGDLVTGTGIQANTTVLSTQQISFSATALLVGTTTIRLTKTTNTDLVAAGQIIAGPLITAGTKVVSFSAFSLDTTGDIVAGSFVVINLASTAGVSAGDAVSGFGLDLDQVVVSVDSPTQVTLSQPASQTVNGVSIKFEAVIVVADTATGSGSFVSVTFRTLRVDISLAATATATGITFTFNAVTVQLSIASSLSVATRVDITFVGATITMSLAATGSVNNEKLRIYGGRETPFTLATTGDTQTSTILANLASVAGVLPGMDVTGANIPASTFVVSVDSPTQVTISAAATGSASGQAITFSAVIQTPLWGAGDCDRNPLLSVPLGVAQMNGRAWFADGTDGIPWSDSGLPCRRTSGAQALTTNDGLPITAIAPLLLTAPITGGIVQALIAFEGEAKMQQITGDPVRLNLTMNLLPVATGSLAPLSIVPTDKGLLFCSPHGLRLVAFDGTVSSTIGDAGKGITQPFINAHEQSRICAAANADVFRVTTQNHLADHAFEEYWFDLTRQIFTGPHTSTASLIQPWRGTFLMTFVGENARIYRSDPEPLGHAESSYIERGARLSCAYRTSLLPDSGDLAMVALNETTLACSLTEGAVADLAMISDFGEVLARASVTGEATATLWNQFNWNEALWNGSGSIFRQRLVAWPKPLVFKQGDVLVEVAADANVRVGNLYMRYQRLGYTLENAS